VGRVNLVDINWYVLSKDAMHSAFRRLELNYWER